MVGQFVLDDVLENCEGFGVELEAGVDVGITGLGAAQNLDDAHRAGDR